MSQGHQPTGAMLQNQQPTRAMSQGHQPTGAMSQDQQSTGSIPHDQQPITAVSQDQQSTGSIPHDQQPITAVSQDKDPRIQGQNQNDIIEVLRAAMPNTGHSFMTTVEEDQPIAALIDDEVNISKEEHKHKTNQLDVGLYIQNAKPYFVNTLMLHYAEEVNPSNVTINESVANHVNNFIQTHLQVKLNRTIFMGEAIACGSVAEGVKLGEYDEFDFIYELSENSIRPTDLLPIKISPETFRSRKRYSTLGEKSFFMLSCRRDVPDAWKPYMKCKVCESPESCQPDHAGRLLHSQAVQAAFMEAIQTAIHDIQNLGQPVGHTHGTVAGTSDNQLLVNTMQEDCK